MPERWKLKNELRTRVSYQASSAQSWGRRTRAPPAKRSRLAETGGSDHVNADADVAENLTFSLTGARIVTFDNNLTGASRRSSLLRCCRSHSLLES